MRYFIFVFFFYSTAFAGEACVKQAKETIEACDKSSFDDVYATAFSNYPYDYKSIFDTLETCTKAVAKCYYNCKNPTISGTATVTEVTGKLKTSYGK